MAFEQFSFVQKPKLTHTAVSLPAYNNISSNNRKNGTSRPDTSMKASPVLIELSSDGSQLRKLKKYIQEVPKSSANANKSNEARAVSSNFNVAPTSAVSKRWSFNLKENIEIKFRTHPAISLPGCDNLSSGKENKIPARPDASMNASLTSIESSPYSSQLDKIHDYVEEVSKSIPIKRNTFAEERTSNSNVGLSGVATKKINFSNLMKNARKKLRTDPAASPVNNVGLPPHSEAKRRKTIKEHGIDASDNLEPSPDHESSRANTSNASGILPISNQNFPNTNNGNISNTNDTPGCSWYIDTKPSPVIGSIADVINKISHMGTSSKENERPEKKKSKPSPNKRPNNPNGSVTRTGKKKGELDIVVKKSSGYIDDNGKVPTYLTISKVSRGKVLVLNNIHFTDSTRNRHGAEIDHINITRLFQEMGFCVTDHQDKTAEDMQEIIKDYCNPSLELTDIQITVIMSHGDTKKNKFFVEGTNHKPVQVQWIIDQFAQCACLVDKPKVFIFQCCRGSREHVEQTDSSDKSTKRSRRTALSDILMACATIPAHVSYRSASGSRYIEAICKIFMEHAHDTHVEDLLKLVDSQVNQSLRRLQTTSYENWGFKKCYLNPVLGKNN